MKVDPNAPLYPTAMQEGIPIRLAIAAQLMAPILLDPRNTGDNYADDAGFALKAADALIAAYNEAPK